LPDSSTSPSLTETPTETVTATVTAEPTTEPTPTCSGMTADPCVVDLSDSVAIPLWTSFGLVLLLLAAVLAAQLRRP